MTEAEARKRITAAVQANSTARSGTLTGMRDCHQALGTLDEFTVFHGSATRQPLTTVDVQL
jgi:hypothetical protein